jgi:hypothetical protein
MNQFAAFTLALGSRFLDTLAMLLSTWLLEKVLEGAELGFDLMADAWEFVHYVSTPSLSRWAAFPAALRTETMICSAATST